eukprot:COSAG05_NODE_41_length_26845_cov_26.599230_3_plen_97_part_00
MSAMVTVGHKPASNPTVAVLDQLRVSKGEIVEVLHQNFDTQWWECRVAMKAVDGEEWQVSTHTRTGQLPSGVLMVLQNYVNIELIAKFEGSRDIVT